MRTPPTWSMIGQQHTEIFQAIKDHDPEAAYAAMKRHITFVLNFFRERQGGDLMPEKPPRRTGGRAGTNRRSEGAGAIRPPGRSDHLARKRLLSVI